jgi:hypothetical protein
VRQEKSQLKVTQDLIDRVFGGQSFVGLRKPSDWKGYLLPPQPSREVELVNQRIHKTIESGDGRGMCKLAETYGMPYLREHLTEALRGGYVDIVKHLIAEGVPTHKAISDYLNAPRENPEILKLLLQAGAALDFPNIPSAIRSGYTESARLLLEYDKSGEHLRLAAEHLGKGENGVQAVESLCAIAEPRHARDILEYAMQGAMSRGRIDAIAAFFDRGARGDRIVWKWGLRTFDEAKQLKELFSHRGAMMPVPARFPLAWVGQSARFDRLREEITSELEGVSQNPPQDRNSETHDETYRQAENILTHIVSSHVISEPLLDVFGALVAARLTNSCKVHDGNAFRAVVGHHREIVDPRFYLLEQIVASGSLDIVKILVEEFGANVGSHDGLPLAIAAHEGYVDILEYLIARGADIHASQEAALCEASRMSNAEVINALLKHGADPRAHRSKGVYDCARQEDVRKHTAALRSAKFLFDAGASPNLFFPAAPYEQGPATQYVRFMAAISSPLSPLYLKTLEPRLNASHINFSLPTHAATPVFRFASSCAAVAARLFASPESPKLFISLFKKGMSKVLDEKAGTFRNLAVAADADIDLFQDVHDVAAGALWDVIIPILVARRDELPSNFEDVIIGRIKSLAYAVEQELFADRSVTEILKFSRIWHRPDKQLPIDAKPLRSNAWWHALLESQESFGQYSIHSLTTNNELVLEGAIMHHCLGNGSYTSSCIQGVTHILSIRKNDIPCATVEIGHVAGRLGEFHLPSGRSLVVIQVRGPGNSAPDPETHRFFDTFRSMIHRGAVILNDGPWGETDASREARQKLGISTLETMTGIRNGEYPTIAVAHYRDGLAVHSAQKDANSRSRKIGLLDAELTERIIAACRVVLRGHPDKGPSEPRDVRLSEVTLKTTPSAAVMLAWEVRAQMILFGHTLLSSRKGHASELSKLTFLPTSELGLPSVLDVKLPPHHFLD